MKKILGSNRVIWITIGIVFFLYIQVLMQLNSLREKVYGIQDGVYDAKEDIKILKVSKTKMSEVLCKIDRELNPTSYILKGCDF